MYNIFKHKTFSEINFIKLLINQLQFPYKYIVLGNIWHNTINKLRLFFNLIKHPNKNQTIKCSCKTNASKLIEYTDLCI